MRRLVTVAMMAALSGALLVGCQFGGGDDTPIRVVPDLTQPVSAGVLNPVAAPGAAPVAGATGQSVGVASGAAAKFFANGLRQKLFLGCPGDIAEDGTKVDFYNCTDFVNLQQAIDFQNALDRVSKGRADCHGLDGRDADTIPCNGVLN